MKEKSTRRRVLKIILLVVFSLISTALIAGGVFALLGWNMHSEAVQTRPVRQVYAELSADEHFVTIDELPEFYVNAVTAVEDRDFWGHVGIDPSAIVRALLHDIRAGSFAEGGSTITMQCAKNLWYTQEKRLERKTAEIFTAFEIEDKLSKEQIFELYVNTIYFGSNYYGIYAASVGYYGVSPEQLTDEQCAVLAGLPQAPSVYSPDVAPELAEQRAQQVLAAMRECGYID
ncbi:MAG: transglycosylase domain-containing protein [Oscillospiraceae bacterium]